MIVVDGSRGEGGGQMLRSSLTLSMMTGQSFKIENIRAKRTNPGLLRQHLTAIRASAAICGAEVDGDALGSKVVEFRPGKVQGGEYKFEIGSAGSVHLVLQTILIPLCLVESATKVVITGGTHVPHAPCFQFVEEVFLPALRRMGADVEISLNTWGFYPVGGGEIVVDIKPVRALQSCHFESHENWKIESITIHSTSTPKHEVYRYVSKLNEAFAGYCERVLIRDCQPVTGKGLVVMVRFTNGSAKEVLTGIPMRNESVTDVVEGLKREAQQLMAAGVSAGEYLADQLLIPAAWQGNTAISTVTPSSHCLTNLEVIAMFLNRRPVVDQLGGGQALLKYG